VKDRAKVAKALAQQQQHNNDKAGALVSPIWFNLKILQAYKNENK
jgi:hypothetical protein